MAKRSKFKVAATGRNDPARDILHALELAGEPLTPKELAKRLRIPRPEIDAFEKSCELAALAVEGFELRGDIRNQSLRDGRRTVRDRFAGGRACWRSRVDADEVGKSCVECGDGFRVTRCFTSAANR